MFGWRNVPQVDFVHGRRDAFHGYTAKIAERVSASVKCRAEIRAKGQIDTVTKRLNSLHEEDASMHTQQQKVHSRPRDSCNFVR